MAAGDLITGPGQVEVGGYLMGEGTVWRLDQEAGGVSGLWDLIVRGDDHDYVVADGVAAGVDTLAATPITAAFWSDCASAIEAATHLAAARTAWAPAGDREMHLLLDDGQHVWVTGRARGLVVDGSLSRLGIYRVLATFLALDPTVHIVGGAP